MDETLVEFLKALGYPISSILAIVVLAYLSRQVFERILESIVSRDLEVLKRQNSEALEEKKKEYALALEDKKAELAKEVEHFKGTFSIVLEDKKAELVRETERLKTTLFVEAETYKIAARKRFECLLQLWESSESLFRDTDFSDKGSIKESLEHVDTALAALNRHSVLFSPSVAAGIRAYLENVAKVLTNSEKNFREDAVTTDKIADFLKGLSGVLGIFSEELRLSVVIAAEIVPSVGNRLEEFRHKSAIVARQNLEKILREEFGVWVSETKALQ
jgi:hypothetical protein